MEMNDGNGGGSKIRQAGEHIETTSQYVVD